MPSQGGQKVKLLAACLLGVLGAAAVSGKSLPKNVEDQKEEQKLVAIIKDTRSRMGISQPVSLAIIEANTRLVSVRRSQSQAGSFIVEFDRNFLSTLDENELRTVIAHEMGHVWIFTHHPFLQTEALA